MATEGVGKIQDQEDSAIVPLSGEDECDGPKRYTHKASPWYSDMKTVLIFGYLCSVLLGGCIILIALVFTQNPWEIFAITFGFVALSIIGIRVKISFERIV